MKNEDPKFDSRKKDHIHQSMNEKNQVGLSPSDEIKLYHKAMPEIDFKDVSLKTKVLGINLNAPIFVSSMTAGHKEGEAINYTLAKACAEKNWLFAVGSQRKQLTETKKDQEWVQILKDFPSLNTVGNLGLAQLISFGPDRALKLIESLNAKALFIHCNPLQEVLQMEGTPNFKNGFKVLKELCELSSKPIIIKETGCGFDKETLKKLFKIKKLYAVDVSGYGGTHWGRIEGERNLSNTKIQIQKTNVQEKQNSKSKSEVVDKNPQVQLNLVSETSLDRLIQASKTYQYWGMSTAESLSYCEEVSATSKSKTKYWASGGVRSGLDIVTCLSMGAEMVGLAQPILKHLLQGYDSLIQYMELLEYETRIGLFCTGYQDVNSCQKDVQWEWK